MTALNVTIYCSNECRKGARLHRLDLYSLFKRYKDNYSVFLQLNVCIKSSQYDEGKNGEGGNWLVFLQTLLGGPRVSVAIYSTIMS